MGTGVAFNNFDRFFDICTGKDTLHDTVAILYQNESSNTGTDCSNLDNCDDRSVTENLIGSLSPPSIEPGASSGQRNRSKRRRIFDAIIPELESYSKKSRMIETLIAINDPA